jgi:DtxR family Mn-dependent transcriptional regulator
MVDAVQKPISDSVQMYLVKIKRMEDEINPVPLSYLAESLSISAVSVNEMCRKMQDQNLIDYQPYKGASLTPEGDREALRILRRHRLWEVFLVEKLNFSFEAAHEMADELEHATSKELADHLDIFLGNPVYNPEGKEIPNCDGNLVEIKTYPLSSLEIGDRGVCLLEQLDDKIKEYLKQSNCGNGVEIEVAGKTDKLILISAKDTYVSVSRKIADSVEVIKNNIPPDNAQKQDANQKNNKERTAMSVAEKKDIKQLALEKLEIGQKGTIISLTGKGPIKQRMMDMGLVPGSEVEVIRVAPLGDPIEINLKGYNLSLRRNEAKTVMVEVKVTE